MSATDRRACLNRFGDWIQFGTGKCLCHDCSITIDLQTFVNVLPVLIAVELFGGSFTGEILEASLGLVLFLYDLVPKSMIARLNCIDHFLLKIYFI